MGVVMKNIVITIMAIILLAGRAPAMAVDITAALKGVQQAVQKNSKIIALQKQKRVLSEKIKIKDAFFKKVYQDKLYKEMQKKLVMTRKLKNGRNEVKSQGEFYALFIQLKKKYPQWDTYNKEKIKLSKELDKINQEYFKLIQSTLETHKTKPIKLMN